MPPRKKADGATQLEVEKMIIDFLMHMASESIFSDFQDSRTKSKRISYVAGEQCEKHLQMVQYFSSTFKRHFPGERLEPKASFRSKLLQYTILFSQRTIPGLSSDCLPSLESLKTGHGRKTSHLSQSKCSSPLGKSQIHQLPVGVEYRAHYLESIRQQGSNVVNPSLLKLQPLFFKLSTHRSALDATAVNIRRDWMNLAGQFMFQAAIEQLLVYGTKDPEVIREIFSWIWKEDKNIDEMFADHGAAEVAEWERVRSSWAALLKPTSKSCSLATHLLQVAALYPLHDFEKCMMSFLATVHSRISPPLLLQLEDGHVDGLSMSQCQDLLQRAQAVA